MFAEKVGVAKRDNVIDVALLEFCIREDLNKRSMRVMTVLNPVKLVIDNYPEGTEEELEAINNPEDETQGTRKVPFSKVLYIEREDFMENPSKKYFRLAPGQEVRLRYAYFVKCISVEKDAKGEISAIHCNYDPTSRGGNSPDGRKVKGTIHWVSVKHAVEAEVRLYDRLFKTENPEEVEEGHNYTDNMNSESLKIVTGYCEPFVANTKSGDRLQFERVGYFCADPDTKPGKPVFNRTVTLKDSWNKMSGDKN
jgi:glutaminyl-tRNA synthetase